jgi:hypothetical protein
LLALAFSTPMRARHRRPTGNFQNGKPVGPGSFALPNGIAQSGEYVVSKPPEGEEEAEIKIDWVGVSVVSV